MGITEFRFHETMGWQGLISNVHSCDHKLAVRWYRKTLPPLPSQSNQTPIMVDIAKTSRREFMLCHKYYLCSWAYITIA